MAADDREDIDWSKHRGSCRVFYAERRCTCAAVPDPRFRDQLGEALERMSVSVQGLPTRFLTADLGLVVDALAPLIAAHVEAEVQAATNQRAAEAIDVEHLERQREWSRATFGPGDRRKGVLDHIRKELVEIEEAGECTDEWFDVVILALDGAWRDGYEPAEIIAAVKAKQAKNERRTWPDWRTADPDRAIEHVRSALTQPAPEATT
jgi:hypothetical protein